MHTWSLLLILLLIHVKIFIKHHLWRTVSIVPQAEAFGKPIIPFLVPLRADWL